MPAQHPQKTLADRVVAWFAPGAAVRRAQARAVLAYFEAARPDRLRKGRRATGSVNDDVLRAGSTLREIARHMEQNYDLALGVLNTLVANVVGANGIGIEPQPRNADGSINDDLARQILELLKDWATCPEVTRQHDWPSAQRMLARSWLRDGEVFAQLVAGLLPSLDHGTRVPFSLEMLEADYVPMGLQATEPARISQGIEINAWGAPVAYRVLLDAPESAASITSRTKRVTADRMLHLKSVHRIRQLRGVSVFASVLNRFDDLKDYEESERIAAKIAASMAAYIKKGAPDLYNPEDGTADDAPRQMKFRPGMVFDDLKPGEDIGMIDTNRPNPNLETYRSGQMKAIAAGTGPTFSSIARTYDGTYSAQRQELVEGYAAYATLSAEFISRIVRPVYERFVATAVASGVLRVPAGIKPETLDDAAYMPPAMPWIDPRKEAEAWALLEDRAYASGPEIVRKRGGNPIDTLEQQARWRREKDKHGIPHNAALAQPTEAERDEAGEKTAERVAARLAAPLAAVAAGVQAAASKEHPAPVVNVAGPTVHNHLPEPQPQPAPVVNVAGPTVHNHLPEPQPQPAPVVNVAGPTVHNHLPEQPAPDVHVHNEVQAAAVQKVEITAMPTRETTTRIERDGKDNILKTTQTEQDA